MRLLLFLFFFLLAACEKTDTPVDPVWGKQPCAHCQMLVSDKRYAAQAVTATGDRLFFDDPGCLVKWMETNKPAKAWVHPGGWVEVGVARFAPSAKTPMDYGFEPRDDGPLGFEEVRSRLKVMP
jgi:copper chaperone NosL